MWRVNSLPAAFEVCDNGGLIADRLCFCNAIKFVIVMADLFQNGGELIPLQDNNGQKAVNARDLHSFLQVSKDYSTWIKKQVERCDLTELVDYQVFTQKGENLSGGRPSVEYILSLNAAKEISMMSQTERGKQARRYFIACEEKLREVTTAKLPHTYIEALEALVASEKEKALLTQQSAAKDETIALLGNELKESAPKVRMYDEYISSDGTATTTQIAKEYGWGAETLNKKLAQLGIHYKQNGQWLLYAKYDDKGYTKSRPITFTRSDGSTCTKMQTRWTAKGREFIHQVINKLFGRVAVC